jgi:endonuclease-8
MPEGDTIFRTARTLQHALGDKTITGFRAQTNSIPPGAESRLVGQTITSVEAQGKNVLMHFSNGFTLHTHMRMQGSWHLYRPGERWRKPAFRARIILEVPDFVAVCFDAPVARLLKQPVLPNLGPDIMKDFDFAEVLRRFREHPDLPIGEAIILQSILAGVGNIYKSEALFLERINPFVVVREMENTALQRLVAKTAEIMRVSTNSTTRSRYQVYRRSGKPCPRCGAEIRMLRQSSRSTYYCPHCQR